MGTQAQTTKPPPTPNMIAIFLALLSLTAAHPDPATLFETIPMLDKEPVGRYAPENIQDVLKDQGILLAEATFDSTLAKSSCLARELCQFGAKEEARFSPFSGQITIGNAIDTFTIFLAKMKDSANRSTKNIDNLLGAVEVGKTLGTQACRALYDCTPPAQRGRVTCETAGNLCPGHVLLHVWYLPACRVRGCLHRCRALLWCGWV